MAKNVVQIQPNKPELQQRSRVAAYARVSCGKDEIDLSHTEMYSCKFSKASFHKVQLIKSEVNDTEFTKQRLGFDFSAL